MYTIYADGELLFSPILSDEGYGVISPKVTKEVNKAGSLSFVLPPGHPFYARLKKLKTIMTVFHDDTLVFCGRVLSLETDFYQRRTVYCEGELAYLNDSVCRPYTFQGTAADLFRQHITKHNAEVQNYAKFTIGNVNVQGTVDVKITDHSSTWEALNEMLESFGGYISVRHVGNTRYIDYLQNASGTSGQMIEFGRNLLDLTEHITAEDVFTVLIPLGKFKSSDTGRLGIEGVNNGNDFIQDDTAVSLFGKIWKTYEWDDINDSSTLMAKGREYLSKGIAEAVTLTVKAVDLHLVDVDTDRIDTGYKIRVVSAPHGMDADFICSSVTLDLVNLDRSTYTFGNPKNTASGVMATAKETAKKTRGGGSKQKQLVEEIKQNGTSLTYNDYLIKMLIWSKIKEGENTSNNQASIDMTAEQILSEVSSIVTNDMNQVISEVKSSIEQTSSGIISKVSKNGVISAINQTAESITIQASKINLSGYVTASELSATNAAFNNLVSGNTEASYIKASMILAGNVTATGTLAIRTGGTFLWHGVAISAKTLTVDGTTYHLLGY